MGRAIAIVLLAVGVAGFGLCSVSAGLWALLSRREPVFIAMSLGTAVLCVLCVLGFRKLGRKPPKPPDRPPAPPPAAPSA